MTTPIMFDPTPQVTDLFELHWGRLATGERVLRKVARNAEGHRLVHAEVNAGNLLAALPTYPSQLCQVIEHELNGPQTYVTTTYRGVPVEGQPTAPLPETALTVFGDLLVAIHTLAKAGLTHSAILPGFVLWDGEHAQLVNLGQAVAIGEPARTALDPLWQPPPGPGGLRLATQAHDVYQAGLVLYCIATLRGPADAATLRAELARGGTALSALLDGVFADDPRDRPDPHQLLRRVEDARLDPAWRGGGEAHIPHQFVPPPPPDSPARLEFRQKIAAKREYRRRRAEPAAVAWRFARDLFDILWYRQDSPYSRGAVVAVAALVVGLPLLLVFLAFRQLKG